MLDFLNNLSSHSLYHHYFWILKIWELKMIVIIIMEFIIIITINLLFIAKVQNDLLFKDLNSSQFISLYSISITLEINLAELLHWVFSLILLYFLWLFTLIHSDFQFFLHQKMNY